MTAWCWFTVVQLVSALATLLGWVLLIPFCLAQSWGECGRVSIKDKRAIDCWNWIPLNQVYGNPEDGVSGQDAVLIGGGRYMPGAWAPWRAYCWSAWRNSANSLKYVFAWNAGPYKSGRLTVFGKTISYGLGWKRENGHYNVPVLSVRLA